MKQIILIFVIPLISGCIFYRKDVEASRTSTTVISMFKNITVTLDPNTINYNSESKDLKVITPYGIVESDGEQDKL